MKTDNKIILSGICPGTVLPGFKFLDRRTAFLEKDTVTTVGTPDVDVDLNFLLAPSTFVGTCHIDRLFPDLINCAVDRTLRDLHCRGHRLVRTTGELVSAFAAFPDTGSLACHGLHVTLGAAVKRPGDLLNLVDPLANKSSIPAAKTS
jgi:hypothetical protein